VKQTPFTAKHPFVILIPPVELNVVVAVVKLIPFVFPIDSSVPGVDEPIPTLPEESIVSLCVLPVFITAYPFSFPNSVLSAEP
jgi:hypothetical protein